MPIDSPSDSLRRLSEDIVRCRACPRLVSFREQVAKERRKAYRHETYWGRAVPGFGDPQAWLAVVGLAPGAHGANRTGRLFTGDRSGDFLFAGLYRAGFANQPTSIRRDDGLQLKGAYIFAPCRCVPPDNRPLPIELQRCAAFFTRELALLPKVRVVLALGAVAWEAFLAHAKRKGIELPRPRPRFGHGAELVVGNWLLLGSYHVSQQNTQTGKLTEAMFDAVLRRARQLGAA